jgi:DNA polymerase III delta subunit
MEEFMADLREKGRLDVRAFDFEERPDAWRSARDFLEQPSLFTADKESKTLVIRGHSSVEESGEKEWAKTLKRFVSAPRIIVLISDDVTKPKKLFSFLIGEDVKSQQFEELAGTALSALLAKEAVVRGIRFSPDAWRFFLSYAEAGEGAIWRGMRGLELIACRPSSSPLTLAEARSLFLHAAHDEVYVLARALIAARGARARLGLLERVFAQKEAGAYFFNSLAYQAKGADAAALAELDVRIKSGMSDYEEALTAFALA